MKISGLLTGHDPTRGSGHEGFKMPRVGSGQQFFKSRGSGHSDTRELFSHDPRVGPTDLARGSVFGKLTAAYRRAILVIRGSEMIQYLPRLA